MSEDALPPGTCRVRESRSSPKAAGASGADVDRVWCQRYVISTPHFHNWQKIPFEGSTRFFGGESRATNVRSPEAAVRKNAAALEVRPVRKDELIAERQQEYAPRKTPLEAPRTRAAGDTGFERHYTSTAAGSGMLLGRSATDSAAVSCSLASENPLPFSKP